MKRALILPIIALYFFFIFFSAVQAYEVTFFINNASASIFTVTNPSLKPVAGTTCQTILNAKTTLTSSANFDVSWQYYSPLSNLLASGSLLNTGNLSCSDLGTVNTTGVSGIGTYESKIRQVQSSTIGGNTKLKTKYVCSNPSNLIQFNYRRDSNIDSNGMYNGAYWKEGAGTTTPLAIISDYDNVCSGFGGNLFLPTKTISCVNSACYMSFIYPFNSSHSGKVNISYDTANSTHVCSGSTQATNVTYEIKVIKLSDLSSLTLLGGFQEYAISPSCPEGIYTNELMLDPNEQYMLVFYAEAKGLYTPRGGMVVKPPNEVNISIDARVPAWSCSDYSDCVNGTKTRLCHDTNGFFEDSIQSSACFPTTTATEYLGFENFTNGNVLECQKTIWSWFYPCIATPQNRTVKLPTGWNINFDQVNDSGTFFNVPRFIDMYQTCGDAPPSIGMRCISTDSNDVSIPEGQYALIMFFVPAKIDEVISTNGTLSCGNKSVGKIPELNKTFNQSIMTTINLASPFSTLSYKIRRFSTPVEQYPATGCNLFGASDQLCYGNCSLQPLGYYNVFLEKQVGGGFVDLFSYYGVANNDWEEIVLDLSNLNLDITSNYTLIFSVTTPDYNLYNPYPIGVAIDDVRINNIGSDIQFVCDTGESVCDPNPPYLDLLKPTFVNGICTIQRITNWSACYQATITAQQQAQVLNTTVFTPIGGNATQNLFDQTGFPQASFFVTPFFLYIAIFLGLAGYADFKIKSGGLIFAIIMILGMVVGTLPQVGIIPVWFTVIFTLVAGVVTVYFLSNIFSRGS